MCFNSLVCRRRNSCRTTTSTSTSSSVSNLPLCSSLASSHSAPSFPTPSHPVGIIHGSVCPSSRSPGAGAPLLPVVHLLLRRAAEAVGGESAPWGQEGLLLGLGKNSSARFTGRDSGVVCVSAAKDAGVDLGNGVCQRAFFCGRSTR